MSFPTRDTIWGQIEFKNAKYDLLDRPLSKEIWDKIDRYKKENHCGISSASWSSNKLEWTIKSDKLYLTSLKCRLCKNQDNLIPVIFDVNEIQASWVNEEIKFVLLRKELGINKRMEMQVEREVLVLSFTNGILQDTVKEIEQFNSKRLRNYTEIEND